MQFSKFSIFFFSCLQALAGLQYLEANKIIHRDIAARNLLVEGKEKSWRVKVSDFGMARFIDRGYYISSGKLKPVRWCAPEVLEYNRYSFKSDVWAFGVTMWEMFSKSRILYLLLIYLIKSFLKKN